MDESLHDSVTKHKQSKAFVGVSCGLCSKLALPKNNFFWQCVSYLYTLVKHQKIYITRKHFIFQIFKNDFQFFKVGPQGHYFSLELFSPISCSKRNTANTVSCSFSFLLQNVYLLPQLQERCDTAVAAGSVIMGFKVLYIPFSLITMNFSMY